MGLEVHHIIEKRFAALLGKDAREMLSVALPREVHQRITNMWRKVIPYGAGTANATREQVEAAAQQIYEGAPEVLDAAIQELRQ